MSNEIEHIAKAAVDCGFKIHQEIGSGLLENAYELLLKESLKARGFQIETQKPISLAANGVSIENAFRADILVENRLLIEVKSTENHAPMHAKQLLTYLRLMKLPLGLLMNFGAPTFKQGVKRLVNNYDEKP